jgi:3-dehydroquinate synthase
LERLRIETDFHSSEIIIGESWRSFGKYIPRGEAVIVTDDNILKIYGKDFNGLKVLSVAPGENSKRLEVIADLANRLLKLGTDRHGFILGIGGGVVCDIAGFLASVYMRGISFGFVSTSLLSQVDASVGGKNGVNLETVKNIIGTFRQPEFVICDPEMLKTLPEDEYRSGLAELIKHGLICDEGLLTDIERNIEAILQRDTRVLQGLIVRSVKIKAGVVAGDEKEKGRRMILNFGHTFGHAIESKAGLKHGYAIAAGMIIASEISVTLGLLSTNDRKIISDLLNSFNLLSEYKISTEQIRDFIMNDKKKTGDAVNFILLEKLGCAIVKSVPIGKLMDLYMRIKV